MALSDFDRRLVAIFLSVNYTAFQNFLFDNAVDESEADIIIDEINKPNGLNRTNDLLTTVAIGQP